MNFGFLVGLSNFKIQFIPKRVKIVSDVHPHLLTESKCQTSRIFVILKHELEPHKMQRQACLCNNTMVCFVGISALNFGRIVLGWLVQYLLTV